MKLCPQHIWGHELSKPLQGLAALPSVKSIAYIYIVYRHTEGPKSILQLQSAIISVAADICI